jgi:peroxiredoxin
MQKKLFPLLIVALIALGSIYYYKHYIAAPSINFQSLTLKRTNGEAFDINSLKGEKTIVFMYASWCGNCLQELKAVNKIRATELSDIEIICISDEEMEKVQGFEDNKKYPFTFLKMDQNFNSVGIYSIPVTYFLNSKLEVVEEKLGYTAWDDASTVQHLKSLF